MSGDDWDDFYIPPESDGPPLVGEDWIAAATRDQLQAECRRLSEVATHNLQRAWKAERAVEVTAVPPDELREAIAAWLYRRDSQDGIASSWHEDADALLAGPLAPLLAKLQAVEALADRGTLLTDDFEHTVRGVPVESIRRALGGER